MAILSAQLPSPQCRCYTPKVRQFTKTSRRRFGTLCLGGAGALLLAGQTVLKDHLGGGGFVIYWLVCLILTLLAMLAALADALSIRAENRESQRALIESTLREIETRKSRAPGNDSGAPPSQ